VAVLLFFAAGEIILRLFFAEQIYSEYGQGPGGLRFTQGIQYNSLGFRDVEHEVTGEAGVSRIILIGDSFTFGAGVEDMNRIYARLLQKKLDEKYGKGTYEVINLSSEGYSTIDALEVLENTAVEMKPDIVILGYYANDAEGPDSRKGFEDMYYHHFIFPYELGGWLYRHSFAYYFLESRAKNILQRAGLTGKDYGEYIRHLYSDSNPFFSRHRQYLSSFITTAKENGAEVVVLNIPVMADFDDYPFAFAGTYVQGACNENGAYYTDLVPPFREHGAEELTVSHMDAHMNAKGHEITAGVLFRLLEKEGLTGKE
jgi:hypothetical protein